MTFYLRRSLHDHELLSMAPYTMSGWRESVDAANCMSIDGHTQANLEIVRAQDGQADRQARAMRAHSRSFVAPAAFPRGLTAALPPVLFVSIRRCRLDEGYAAGVRRQVQHRVWYGSTTCRRCSSCSCCPCRSIKSLLAH